MAISGNFSFRFMALVFLLVVMKPGYCLTEKDTVSSSGSINKKRLTGVLTGGTLVYAAGMTALYGSWYRNYEQSPFHFFDDSREWLQVDKTGHLTTSYYVGYLGYQSFRYTGMDEKRSALLGGLTSWLSMATIEVFDGFSEQWGASVTDLCANTLGSALFTSQQIVWHEQRILVKWSYHPTKFPDYRPDLLGDNFAGKMLKDYNGHTYWLSVNLKSFLDKNSGFPAWLNFAFGYGAEGMTGAAVNSSVYNGKAIPHFERQRQYYFGPDIDLTRIRTRSKVLNALCKSVGFIRLPLPAVEFSKSGICFHPLYF